ncbi:hypothetical protein ACFQU7_04040 [Pseudoroseomonas wenyumeiae]
MPSFRATRDEQHLTRGRANTLRLALTGQLGPHALAGDEVAEALSLCVSCKGCKRECPTGVDMAKMKIEASHARAKKHGIRLKDRIIAELPRWAPWAAKLPGLANLRDTIPAWRRCRNARWASPPGAACPASAATPSAMTRRGMTALGRRSSSSPIPSTAITSPRTCAMP